MKLNEKEVELFTRLIEELKLWPGAEETPHGTPLSEEDDKTLIAFIQKLEEAK